MSTAVLSNEPAAPPDVVAWRHELHAHPELLYDVIETAAFVKTRLEAFGCNDIVPGVGRTGVVAVIKGRRTDSGRVIAIRADMDALPVHEQGSCAYASKVPGRMHACGHDGHTAIALGTARALAESRNFNGTAIMVFQPAEEGGAGALAMLRDGLMERWGIQEIYGLHNLPGLPVGKFAMRPGPIMASSDMLEIVVAGRGGHAAKPNECADPLLAGAHIVVALQSIVARNADPLDAAVVSITAIEGGSAFNVIPDSIRMRGTARSLSTSVRDLLERRIVDVAEGTARTFSTVAKVAYQRGYPVTVNDPEKLAFAAAVAVEVAGRDNVDAAARPIMAGEDFSFMLEARPGAFVFLGNGDSAGLHHPAYDFDDRAIPYGIAYFKALVERAMPL